MKGSGKRWSVVALVGTAAVVLGAWWAYGGVDSPEAVAADPVVLPGEEIVIARVGPDRNPVTAYDVQQTAQRTLGKLADVALDGSAHGDLAESVIASRAIATLRESELDATARAKLDKRVAAYRERLLVSQYLDVHADQVELSEDELRRYYDKHRDKFGARPVRTFELAYVELGTDPSARASLLKALSNVGEQEDWRTQVATSQAEGMPVGFRRGESELGNLPPRIRKTVRELEAGDKSNIIILGERGYLVRVTKVSTRPGKSFEDVRDDIAKVLEPRATRRALDSIQDQALAKVEIERVGRRVKPKE